MNRDFEDEIRRSWHPDGEPNVDVDDLLGRVQAGARRRRSRSGLLRAAAAVAFVAAGGLVWSQSNLMGDERDHSPGSDQSVGTSPSTQIDIGFTLLSLTATGTDNQWVLGTSGCASSRCLFIKHLHRADEVAEMTPPPSKIALGGPKSDTVGQLRFANSGGLDGWAFGGALWSTHDYGVSWQKPTLPVSGEVSALEAWGDNVYAAVQHDGHASLIGSSVRDDHWSVITTKTMFARIDSIGASQSLAAVAGVDRSGHATVLTKSAGRDWAPTSVCAHGTSARLSTTQHALWVLCRQGDSANALVSSDGGRHFTKLQGSFAWDTEIAGRTSTTAMVAGAGGVIEVSTSAAPRAIRKVPGFEKGDAEVTYIGFTNPDYGYLISRNGGLVRTTDGGQTWRSVSLD
jgi:photosystem II stability/assembly factor-like uncharacterized protein